MRDERFLKAHGKGPYTSVDEALKIMFNAKRRVPQGAPEAITRFGPYVYYKFGGVEYTVFTKQKHGTTCPYITVDGSTIDVVRVI